jgi:extradiol dioxygenase family protein
MDAFYASRHFQETLRPIPHAIDILQELKQDYELHVVTSRQFAIQERTLQWIETHYPNIFTEIHFGNHYSREGKVRSKPEICRDIGAVLLIDDSLQYAYQCHTANIPVVLFGEYAWNQKHSVHPALFKDGDVAIHKFDRELHTTDIDRDMDISSALYRVHDWRHMKEAIDYILHRHRVIAPAATDADTPVGAAVAGRLRVAAVQMCSVENKLKNLQTIARLVRRAVAEGLGAELVCLPECCTFMGLNGDQTVAAAEPIIRADVYPQVRCKYDWRAALPEEYDGWSDINCTAALCEIAHTSHVWLSVGGFAESRTIDGVARMSNTHFLISPQGQVLESSLYRKIHLFDAPLVGLQESRTTGRLPPEVSVTHLILLSILFFMLILLLSNSTRR